MPNKAGVNMFKTHMKIERTKAVLSVVVPTHQRPHCVRRLLVSLARQTLPSTDFEIILVSNFIEPRLQKIVDKWRAATGHRIQLLVAGQLGVNRARNLGLRHSDGEAALLLDDDCYLPDPKYLEALLKVHAQTPGVLAVGGAYLDSPELGGAGTYYNLHCNQWLGGDEAHARLTTRLLGGAVSYKMPPLRAHGLGFDEAIPYGGSETEFHDRLVAAGFQLMFHPRLAVVHACHISTITLLRKAYRQGEGHARIGKSAASEADQKPRRRSLHQRVYARGFTLGEKSFARTKAPSGERTIYWLYFFSLLRVLQQLALVPLRAAGGAVFWSAYRLLYRIGGIAWALTVKTYWIIYPVPRHIYWSAVRAKGLARTLLSKIYWRVLRPHRLLARATQMYWTFYPVTYYLKSGGWRRPLELLRLKMPLTYPAFETSGPPRWTLRYHEEFRSWSELYVRTVALDSPWFHKADEVRQSGLQPQLNFAASQEIVTAELDVEICVNVRVSQMASMHAQILERLRRCERKLGLCFVLDARPRPRLLADFLSAARQLPQVEWFSLEMSLAGILIPQSGFEAFRRFHIFSRACEHLNLPWRPHYKVEPPVCLLALEHPARFTPAYLSAAVAPIVSVIIPHHCDLTYLRAVLACFCRQNLPRSEFEILIVDNGVAADLAAPADAAHLIADFSELNLALHTLESTSAELFLSGHARNVGLKHAKGRIIQFMDSDILFGENFLRELIARMETCDVVMAKRSMLREGCRPGDPAGVQETDFYQENEYWENFKSAVHWIDLADHWKYACTYCLAVKRSVLALSGPFDPEFTMYGFEDVDLAFRLFKQNARFGFAQSWVLHLFPSRDKHNYHVNEARRARALQLSALTLFKLRPEKLTFILCQTYFAPTLQQWLQQAAPRLLGKRKHVVAPPAVERSSAGISIVIPCLNEERTIAIAVDQAFAALEKCGGGGEVLVADNGSDDRSREIARRHGARVVSCPERGYGACLRAGLHSAAFEYLAMVDADLSYPLLELPNLIAEIDKGCDFVLGNRLRGLIEPRAMPWLNRYVGTPVLSWILRRLYALPTYDCNSGMRAFTRSHFLAMNLRSSGMELASEMLVRVAQLNLRYGEVAISFHKDQRRGKSHLNRWRDGWRHLRLILRNP